MARAAALPGLERGRVVAPGEALEALVQGSSHGVRERGQQVMAELAPPELSEEGAGGAPRARRLFLVPARRPDGRLEVESGLLERSPDGVPDLARRQLAPAQVRREARAALEIGPVAVGGIGAERAVEKRVETAARAALARRPHLHEARRPRRESLGLQLGERHPGRVPGRRRKRLRRRQRRPRPRPREPGAPERREHSVRTPVASEDGERIGEQVDLRRDDRVDALCVQGGLECAVARDLVGLQAARPHHRAGSGLGHQRGDDAHGVAAVDEEPGAEAPQIRVECPERRHSHQRAAPPGAQARRRGGSHT